MKYQKTFVAFNFYFFTLHGFVKVENIPISISHTKTGQIIYVMTRKGRICDQLQNVVYYFPKTN